MQHLKHNTKLSSNTISRAARFSKQKGVLFWSMANALYFSIQTVTFIKFMSYLKGQTSRRVRYFSIFKVLLSQSEGPWQPKEGMDHEAEACPFPQSVYSSAELGLPEPHWGSHGTEGSQSQGCSSRGRQGSPSASALERNWTRQSETWQKRPYKGKREGLFLERPSPSSRGAAAPLHSAV